MRTKSNWIRTIVELAGKHGIATKIDENSKARYSTRAIPAVIRTGNRSFDANVSELATNSLIVTCEEPLSVSDRVTLKIPGSPTPDFNWEGRISSVTDSGDGVRSVEIEICFETTHQHR
jgi:hypothetical protein